MSKDVNVEFGPIDRLNPRSGYQLKIVDSDNGTEILHTSVNPVTGEDLTAAGCVEVLINYLPARQWRQILERRQAA